MTTRRHLSEKFLVQKKKHNENNHLVVIIGAALFGETVFFPLSNYPCGSRDEQFRNQYIHS